MKLNRKIEPFGEEHNKLQASVMAVRSRANVVRIQNKHSMEDDATCGFMSVPEDDWDFWKKDDPEGVQRVWHFHEVITPENGEDFLVELGVNIKEILDADNLLI